ncbi:MAG: prephenate dehydratase [Lentisphaerae bacterium]|jgi:chorismate mutase / prephenate dehydratase|nr:prephenate dehydratase [Lentisphaerota bacterium]MBT5605030.1 prephenate dehydratase [Lentisphaerota bacterium]MBT7054660.1 prephenate dehydratase [Lentisphaerota bacterium]MBT7844689.1 prephenate dehydratase [Lentisphaerota bacterium]
MDLEAIRTEIDRLDAQIVGLLNQRFQHVLDVGEYKRERGLEVYVPERESLLLKRLAELNEGPMDSATLRAVYREIISAARLLEDPLGIAFLGPESTFTHQAALNKFGRNAHYLSKRTIADVFDAVERDHVSYGVVPVENSTEGAVTHTLDMFLDSSVKICAEVNMVVHHNLLSHSAKGKLRVIYSHPQVFGQCRRWLQSNLPGVPLIEVSSTTEAAARSSHEEDAGALASSLAAERYGLEIQEANIEDLTDNTTRFLVLGKQEPKQTGDDKTSILFVVRDRVGALYDSLKPLSEHEISMTFIESRPSRRKSWEYYFFVDFLGHLSEENVQESLEGLGEHCQFVKIMGSYPRGGAPD